MRITGGELKNKKLEVPSNEEIRPTKDIVREAVFMILGEIDDLKVLDLFAGTGAMGIESLSRGARSCDFVDNNAEVCTVLRKNLQDHRINDKVDIYCEKVKKHLSHPYHEVYDLVFFDPPYKYHPKEEFELIASRLAENGVLIYLHGTTSQNNPLPILNELPETLKIIDTRVYGKTEVSFIQKAK